MNRLDYVMRGMTSGLNGRIGRLRHAWYMATASFAYSWRYPLPEGERIGFWYSLRGAWQLFREYL